MIFGDRSLDLAASESAGHPIQRIKEHVPVTSQNSSIIAEYLKFLGTHVVPEEGHLFTFRFLDEDTMQAQIPGNIGSCNGTTFSIMDFQSSDGKFVLIPKGRYNRVRVVLHGDYYIAARKFRDTDHLDTNHILRFYFMFAITLVHEVGD